MHHAPTADERDLDATAVAEHAEHQGRTVKDRSDTEEPLGAGSRGRDSFIGVGTMRILIRPDIAGLDTNPRG
jgi:hypothetical protein